MYCLFFDCASHRKVFALLKSGSVHQYIETSDAVGDDQLDENIKSLLQKESISFQDLSQIVCVVGPGGFTSLRISVSYANALSDQLNIPSVGINLCNLMRFLSKENNPLWIHSTKKDLLFVQGGKWKELTCISVSDFIASAASLSNTFWVGEVIPEHREILNDLKLKEAELNDIKDNLGSFISSQKFTNDILIPWYGRKE